jgi:urease accessory protein
VGSPVGKLHLTVGHRATGSYPKSVHFTPPFNIANIGQDRADPAVYMMTMSSSPGILDDDILDIRVVTEANSRLMLKSQGYQRVFNMQRGARQRMELRLHEASEISYIQNPIVPHKNARLSSTTQVYLDDGCILTLAEIITCGRKLCGESFRFTRFHTVTEIHHHGRLILKDNILLEPAVVDVQGLGHAEGFTHQATLIHVNLRSGDAGEERRIVEGVLDGEEDLAYGVSQPQDAILVARTLAHGAEQIYGAFRRIEALFWERNKRPESMACGSNGVTS